MTEVIKREEELEVETGETVRKVTEAVAAGTREEWLLATSSATRVWAPGLTFSKV